MQVYLIDRPGLTQASVALGEVGISLTDPDHYALEVLNDILNSFGGKLFDQIRSREVRLLHDIRVLARTLNPLSIHPGRGWEARLLPAAVPPIWWSGYLA